MGIFTTMGHVAFKVNDLDRSVAFYETIGFPEMLRLLDAEGKPWIVYHKLRDNLYLELFPGGTGQPVPDGAQTGLNHFCLTVADIDRAEAELAKAGIQLMRQRKEGRGVDGNRGMWIADPDGNRIEIQEMAPDCIQYRAERALAAGDGPTTLTAY